MGSMRLNIAGRLRSSMRGNQNDGTMSYWGHCRSLVCIYTMFWEIFWSADNPQVSGANPRVSGANPSANRVVCGGGADNPRVSGAKIAPLTG
jgi:hypothetical protein